MSNKAIVFVELCLKFFKLYLKSNYSVACHLQTKIRILSVHRSFTYLILKSSRFFATKSNDYVVKFSEEL